jgi:hypothetical protein
VLSNDSNPHRHPQCQFAPTTSVLGGEVGGPASRSRVTTSVVDVVFALFVRSLSFCPLAFFVDGVCSFLFVLFSLSVRGVRSVGLVQYIDWDSGCRSIQSTLHTSLIVRHFPSVSSFGVFSRHSGPFDSQGSIVGPQALVQMVVHMSRRLAESALLIGSMVLSNDSNSRRQFVSIAPGPFDFRGSVVEPQALDRMVVCMSTRLAESALLIGSMVLSNDSNSHRHRSPNSLLWSPGPSIFEEASSDLRRLIEWCSICLKDSLKVPY